MGSWRGRYTLRRWLAGEEVDERIGEVFADGRIVVHQDNDRITPIQKGVEPVADAEVLPASTVPSHPTPRRWNAC